MVQRTPALQTASDAAGRKNIRKRSFFSAENPWLWMLPGVGLLFLYSIVPLFYNLILSFNKWDIRNKVFDPVGFENWQTLLTDTRLHNSIWVTLQYSAIALIVQLLLGLTIALLLDERPWGSGVMTTLLILPMVVAPAVAGMMFRLLEHSEFGAISWVLYQLGVLNPEEPLMGGTGRYALIGLLVVDVWQWTPFFILILLSGLKGQPQEILEASQVDGASWWQQLFRIRIPLLRGVLTVAVMFRLIDLYRVFDYVMIMTSGGPGNRTETLSFYGYVNTFQLLNWGYGAVLALVIVAFAWLSIFIYQKVLRVQW